MASTATDTIRANGNGNGHAPRDRDPLHVSESQRIVRTRQFPTDTDLLLILSDLRRNQSTGTLMIDLSQGGIGSVRFREEQKF